MPKTALTDVYIKQLKHDGKQSFHWDAILPNFGVRLSQKGTKAYVVMLGGEDSRKMKTIGRYPDMPLKQARITAVEILGQDPTQSPKTYSEAVQRFVEASRKRVKKATANQYDQYLSTMAFNKNLDEITKADINLKLAIYDGKPWAQNYAYASLRTFLNWCLDNGYVNTHPLVRGKPPNKTFSRERVLTDQELARVWRATKDDTYGRMVRVMILTGQRRMEVRNLKPEDIADGLITFHTKGDNQNVLPLTPLVEENLVLPFTFNNWSNSLARLASDARLEFRHHDVRRTLATKMAQLGVNDIVIERVLGHTVENVKHTYNRYSYLPEVKEALLKYEEYVRNLIAA